MQNVAVRRDDTVQAHDVRLDLVVGEVEVLDVHNRLLSVVCFAVVGAW